jgi:hypothetical protein
VIPAPESSDATGPGVADLPLMGSPGSPPPPIDWSQVEDNMEFACSQVTVVERLLRETLASVSQNILNPIWVSFKKEEGNVCLCASGSL